MWTFRALCNELIRDVGIGQEIADVSDPGNGELRNVVRWIRDACEDIDKHWIDWRYLWRQYDATLTLDTVTAPEASLDDPVRRWCRNEGRMRVYYGGVWTPLCFVRWSDFSQELAWQTESGLPAYWTERPDKIIQVSPPPDDDYQIRGFYWRTASELVVNADEPLMPNEHRQIIVSRAKIMYGDREDAPEVIAGAESAYLSQLSQLEGTERPGGSQDRMSQNDEILSMDFE